MDFTIKLCFVLYWPQIKKNCTLYTQYILKIYLLQMNNPFTDDHYFVIDIFPQNSEAVDAHSHCCCCE